MKKEKNEKNAELIPKERFRELIEKKAVRATVGHGATEKVLEILKTNAATADGISRMTGLTQKAVFLAIHRLRHKYGKKIVRFYNPSDHKYYYYLDEEAEE